VLRYVKYSVYSSSTEVPVGMVMYAALQSYGMGRFKRAVICFFRFSIYCVLQFSSYILLFLTFHCIMPLDQFNAFFNHG